MAKELIRLSDCFVQFDDDIILDHINLYINDKEFLTLLGPSGCGKTTTLRLIGGFLKPTSGEVLFDGERINDVPPHKRAVNTVFQKYALFPHLNVFENIAFGLRIPQAAPGEKKKRKLPESEIQQRVMEMLEIVNLKGFEKRSIASLSGGQQQRVAIARALVNQPKVLLLDEPLGALDMRLRKDMQNELKRIQQTMGITFIYVTHDQEEALAMSDTVVVMDGGHIQQIGTPEDIYNEPKNAFVADFIGESNIIDGIMRADGVVEIFNRKFQCLDKGFEKDEPVDVVIRPEDVDIVPEDQGQLRGTVTSVTFKGMQYDIIVDFYGFKWLIQTTDFCPVDSRIGIKIDPDGIHVMKKSQYSGMFGDYSSYSEEYEEISDAEYDPEAEEEQEDGHEE
ncbi:spermidine/putrescine ABC transporter ATP-binding protein [Flavonifractor sp. An92]|uniref:ABC transporter ATP-binding protein n=1 Tax=Flavonifractor sp. An92 TaxID=1965666 RepID=UPI000B3A21F7|nr:MULTISPECIES: ABC transporter ATP-binding protein [unclassified Flavonifractor]OUN07621.1 spermidine/putrescine ABC transporter ATP-binding protein [Flavonifractor sp. An92]OUQ21022.1 spermidine/putrescine ABC transporter ATP-binding protein [Flavonifractor sp. An135]